MKSSKQAPPASSKDKRRPPQQQSSKDHHQTKKEEPKEYQKLRFRLEETGDNVPIQYGQPNFSKRLKFNVKAVSQGFKNKLSIRFSEIDRLFVCRKTKEQRANMGTEYEGIRLVEVYGKAAQHRVAQKYGKSLIIQLSVTHDQQASLSRKVRMNPAYTIPKQSPEEEQAEEALLDEQKMFQTLHDQLLSLQRSYGKTIEHVSELFLRVCGDLEAVEQALQGKPVIEWSYLEDLALTKPQESTEYQWLLRSKGQKEIEKRRRFLLTADAEDENDDANGCKEQLDQDMECQEENDKEGGGQEVPYI